MFAGEVGSPRLLRLFDKYELRTSWFVPGHSIETFPDQMRAVADAGHEIGAHGYSHENPIAMSPQQERDVLAKSIELIEELSGRAPRGYVAPWWELSEHTASLLLDNGFSYDHSQNYNDFTPFYARVGDSWTKVDYSKAAAEWMKPLVRGREVDLVEFCGNWYVDDLPPMMFIKQSPNSHGFVSPRDIEQLWRDQFDWIYREMDYGVFPVTLHPDVSGRPQVLLMLERLIEYWRGHDGVRFLTMEEAAEDFRRRFPFGERVGARKSSVGAEL
jgi:peptidoglycan/xylan/chitin deacetylase (PgdA/CDA1 family)